MLYHERNYKLLSYKKYTLKDNSKSLNYHFLHSGSFEVLFLFPTMICTFLYLIASSLVAQKLKCLPAMRETQGRSLVRKIPWRRKWQPTPVFLPGEESHGQRSLVGYSPQGHKESDRLSDFTFTFTLFNFTRFRVRERI